MIFSIQFLALNFCAFIYCCIHLYLGLLCWRKYRSLLIFNLELCPLLSFTVGNGDQKVTFDYIWFLIYGVTRRRGRCFGSDLYFLMLLSIPWFISFYFLVINFPVIREYIDYFSVLLYQFQLFIRLKYWKLSGAFHQHVTWEVRPRDYQLQI